MNIERFQSDSEYEKKFAYSRSVVAGGFIHISGTVTQEKKISDSVLKQCESALNKIKETLEKHNATFADTVRVTYYLKNRNDFVACAPALRKAFGDSPPAIAMIECDLIDPKYLIEIELTALAPSK